MKTYSRKRKTVEETAHIVVQDANFDEKRIKLEPGEEDPLQISSQPMLEFNNIKSETHVNSLIKDEITFSCSQNNSLAENISSASSDENIYSNVSNKTPAPPTRIIPPIPPTRKFPPIPPTNRQ